MSIDVNIGTKSLNFANGNFVTLWTMLDLPATAEGSVTAGDLMARIMLAQAMGVQERPRVQDGNWINAGLDLDYMNHRFGAMLDMLGWVDAQEEVYWY